MRSINLSKIKFASFHIFPILSNTARILLRNDPGAIKLKGECQTTTNLKTIDR